MCDNRPESNYPPPRRSPYMANMSKPMPTSQKVKLVTRNVWLRLAKMQTCCGHYGEPGC